MRRLAALLLLVALVGCSEQVSWADEIDACIGAVLVDMGATPGSVTQDQVREAEFHCQLIAGKLIHAQCEIRAYPPMVDQLVGGGTFALGYDYAVSQGWCPP